MKSENKMILLVALVCAAPFLSAWVVYYFYTPDGGQSYGQLAVKPVPRIVTDAKQVEATKGKWLLVQRDETCEKNCSEALYATRQARTILHKESDRVTRVLLTANPVPAETAKQHPDVLVLNAAPPTPELTQLLLTKNVLIDPQSNQVIAWDRVQDLKGIKRLSGDLSRLLRANKWSTEAKQPR